VKATNGWLSQSSAVYDYWGFAGKPLTIYGDGEQTVDLVYVGDVAEACILAGESEAAEGKIIEIGSGEEVTVNDMAKLIIKLTNSNSTINHIPMRRGELPCTHIKADISAMRDFLVYVPHTSLEEAWKNHRILSFKARRKSLKTALFILKIFNFNRLFSGIKLKIFLF